jgi:hypothetical protein
MNNMTPIQPDQKFTVTMDVQEWNNVLAALNEAPHRVAAPLIRKIVGAIEAHQATVLNPDPNGLDEHVQH